MATKRKVLTLDQRVEAIRLLDSGKCAYKVAEYSGNTLYGGGDI